MNLRKWIPTTFIAAGLALASLGASGNAFATAQCCVPGHWKTQTEANVTCTESGCESTPGCGVLGGTPSLWAQASCVDVPLACEFVLSGNQNIPTFSCETTGIGCTSPEKQCTGAAIANGTPTVQNIRNCKDGTTICHWVVDEEGGHWEANGTMDLDPDWWKYPGGWAGEPWPF